ncbi:MAG: EcoKI restriction-modification system protein HsdS [Syntrophorhabdus sp. PtaU1.Bin002]|nr:MAG: EcoKI restriction-modification system protein HsdS [Syntrophorhabdus sp. PtaB.Bin006]OPY72231.1 MAG: EcoKI restriction-modification system protein HsdS [Syntrophorhabdus sp. PtaU1.Bin002]
MNWPVRPIKTVIKNTQYGLSVPADAHGSIPIVGMKDIQDGHVVVDNDIRVALPKEQADAYRLKKGDILLNRTNSPALVGKAGIVRKDIDAVFASYLVRISLDDTLADSSFINHYINSEMGQRQMKTLSTRAIGQANINPTVFGRHFFIPLPSVRVQREIAALLCSWDCATEKTEELIARNRERHQWLTLRLLTGQQRLPTFYKPWRTVRLGEVFTNRVEIGRPDLPLVAITGENGVVRRDDLSRRDTSTEDKGKYLRICPGDIGYNTMRMWQGVCGFSRLEGIVSPAYTIATPTDKVDGEFMACFFKTPSVIHLFFRHSQGLVDDTLNLKWHHFSEIEVTIPDRTEQRALAAILRDSSREIDLLRKQSEALRLQKRGLMQKLLTGEWRIKIDEPEMAGETESNRGDI